MFRAAHASAADWREAVESCLAALGPRSESADGKGSLGFVYVTEALAARLGVIVELLRERTGVLDWAGAAGLGIASLGGTSGLADYFDEPAIAVMIADLPVGSYKLLASPEALERTAKAAPKREAFDALPLLLLHADGGNPRILEMIDDAAAASGGYLIGGLTTSRSPRHQVAGMVTASGLSGVLFAPGVGLVTALSQGCTPIGDVHTVTRAQRNYIFELDERPALDVLREDIGDVLARDLRRAAGFIHAALPVAGSDTGDYVVRNLVGVDDSQGVVAIADEVETGDPLMFVSRDANAARADFTAMLERTAARAGGCAKGALFISCIARGPNMFGARGAELELIRAVLGEVPLVGMYANGEISNNRLYGYTGVLTLFVD